MKRFKTLSYKGFLWLIKAQIPDREDLDIAMLKTKYCADLCLRKQGYLYLVEIIEDAEIVEDDKEDNKQ